MTERRGFDAIFVGAGVIGLSCAWRAARAGARVAVLDRAAPPAGATRVAAGMLAPVGELAFGEPELLQMTLAAAEVYPGFVGELEAASGTGSGYERCGASPCPRAAAFARTWCRLAAPAPLSRAGARSDAFVQRRGPRA